jgi:heme-degrading monooxygenase HmoA
MRYGTIARMRLREGVQEQALAVLEQHGQEGIPGWEATYLYQSDQDPNEFFAVIMFESREAYHANAQSPEQHRRFTQLMEFMAAEPEWHDGTIIGSVLKGG